MKIGVGSDHAGFELKNRLIEFLRGDGHEVRDFGPESAERCDYPDFAWPVAQAVAGAQLDRGILVCGSGIGMSMAANRVPGARAVVAVVEAQSRLARAHNDANILCIGQRLTTPMVAEDLVRIFLQTEFEGGRHQGRVAKIEGSDRPAPDSAD